jgi:hypothetical protein
MLAFRALLAGSFIAVWPLGAPADVQPSIVSPSASPSAVPSPSPTTSAPPPGVVFTNMLVSNGAVSAAAGPGVLPPEGPGFIAGSPLAPQTPYDFLTTVPTVNGIGASVQLLGTANYTAGALRLSAGYGFQILGGSANTIGYWNEPFFPSLNPHFSGARLALPVAFTTHAGQDDTSGIVAAVTDVHIVSSRGGWAVNAGWIAPAQTLRFVFAPPPNVVAPLAILQVLPETLGPGAPTLDTWNAIAPAIPMQGVEAVKSFGTATLALDAAALPALPGTAVRMSSVSLINNRGDGNLFGMQYLHANESGIPILAGVLFGESPMLDPNAQGNLPTSILRSQQQTLVGVSQALHHKRDHGLVEIGRSWYAATPVPIADGVTGGYYHVQYAHDFNAGTFTLDWYRFEPHYAQTVLPYGTPGNIWSVAWSWPGVWLKSTYQLVDNTIVGINREGFRGKWSEKTGAFEYTVEAAHYRQVEPETVANALREGFVDGFFLPQPTNGSLGTESQLAGFVTWHARFADVTADLDDDVFHRPSPVARDYVSYDVPQYVLAATKTLTPSVVVSAGLARYGMNGSWATFDRNVAVAQRQFFAGGQVKLDARNTLMIAARRLLTTGPAPTTPFSSDMTANLLIVEDRFSF